MHSITILALPSAMLVSVAGPMDLLTQVGVVWNEISGLEANPSFDVKIASLDGKPVTCAGGLSIVPHMSIQDVKATDLIIISSCTDRELLKPCSHEVVSWLTSHHNKGSTIVGICTGAFLLAETGLLEGKTATTHWGSLPEFQKKYPRVQLKPGQLITDEGNLLCSCSCNSYLDLSLHLVERYCGRDMAVKSAKIALPGLDRHLQSSYGAHRFENSYTDKQIISILQWIENNYAQNLDLDQLAATYAMSRRTFERRFKAAVGIPPLLYIQRMRIEAAKAMLKNSMMSFEEITFQVGYDNSHFFRKIFTKHTGLRPKEYQRKFRQS